MSGLNERIAGLSPESRAQRFQSAAVAVTPATLDMVTGGHVLVANLGGWLVALGRDQVHRRHRRLQQLLGRHTASACRRVHRVELAIEIEQHRVPTQRVRRIG